MTYVQPYISTWTEKKLPAFWWIYTTLGRGVLSRVFSLFSGAVFALRFVALAEEEIFNLHPQAKALVVFLVIVWQIL